MKNIVYHIMIVIVSSVMLSSLCGCGESEVEKAARRQNEADEAMEKLFHVVEPKGNHPMY